MRLYPTTRADKIRAAILGGALLLAPFVMRLDRVLWYHLSDKQEGDILMQSLPKGELVDAIEGITGSPWSHCGILVKHEGEWKVAEALGSVRYTPLSSWVTQGRGFVVQSYRVKNLSAGHPAALARGVQKLLGRAYDIQYAPDDSSIYCSELVYKVYERELGIEIGMWQALGDLNWRPFEGFILKLEPARVPLEREMITPVGLTVSPLVERVF
jgi:hypothetical protein